MFLLEIIAESIAVFLVAFMCFGTFGVIFLLALKEFNPNLLDKINEWFFVCILIFLSTIPIPFYIDYQQSIVKENNLLRNQLILLNYDDKNLVITKYKLKEIQQILPSKSIFLECDQKNFFLSQSVSFDYQDISKNNIPKNAIICE
ncbi:hypothetical protein [Crocosphaera chwakensis]|uniref:Uncharacterized protein n=1 Tax=Crocosphaera chwakensis CCY0110 TaxID=391612 RepID=A3IYU6_9CHRO|nr:hypothetical protein [Crocosphaera chwakensis]EAZ88357.1 hypothetical protein CY0110_31095 [Crocosphaera chwakensis CCY0110]